MKNSLFLNILLLTILSVLFACKKETDPTIPPPYYPPNDTTLHTAKPLQIVLDVPNASVVYNAWGKLIALKSDSSYINSHGDTVHTGGQYATAFFTDSSTTQSLYGGAVTINGTNIYNTLQNNYRGSTSALDAGCAWVVVGSTLVPAMSYVYTGSFPQFTGNIPYAVTKNNGVSLTFNSSTLSNTDSVYVVISSSDANNVASYYTKIFAANAGTVLITGSDFNFLPANSNGNAHILLVPFQVSPQAFGDKKYVFVKQAEIAHTITLQ